MTEDHYYQISCYYVALKRLFITISAYVVSDICSFALTTTCRMKGLNVGKLISHQLNVLCVIIGILIVANPHHAITFKIAFRSIFRFTSPQCSTDHEPDADSKEEDPHDVLTAASCEAGLVQLRRMRFFVKKVTS